MSSRPDNVISFPRQSMSDIEADAARWLSRMTSGSLTLGELAEFEYWRASSPDHSRVYRELESFWDGLAPRPAPRRRSLFDSTAQRLSFGGRSAVARLTQIAAALTAVVLTSQYLSTWRYDFATSPGEIREISLADGSRVYLKGDTAIDVNVTSTGARSVKLARGEAFFEVKHDDSRPFTVDAGSGIVRDVGTAFSVLRQGRSVSVAVAEGIVAINAAGQTDMLFKGQQVGFNTYDMSAKATIDPAAISAWRRGLYVADDKTLGNVLSDLGEYYPHRIVMTNAALANRRVNAVVQLNHIDDWLEALNDTKGVSVRRYGPVTVVSAR